MHQGLAVRSADASEDRLARSRRQELDLGVLGAEQSSCRDQQLPDREAEFRRALRLAHRLVEELEVLALLPLRHVGAEGGHARERGDDEQQSGGRARLDQQDTGHPEAGGRESANQRDDERPGELRRNELRFGNRDHRRDQRDPDGVGDRRREQHDRPGLHALGPTVLNRAEDEQRDAGAERHLGEIERQLDRPLPPVHGEGDTGADHLSGQ